ncbi:hypothetical protein M409DRAFT_53935 [Zasmidium cellare ATCC 36951]|uniref:Uncharacterized protein n=1 Tax=Zasmidium cellare ATCC 36951 TaxID=1080233 RepID=A0A6A6CJX6_ZASCE|nr:uncharacterized protein M409DRAFT_53935 [Zasmidium cellare ATCC 36951]KAF2167331.1 hypothetical protein M409DRAFT_53935 [Zasmidium cellare ATCC 36951]
MAENDLEDRTGDRCEHVTRQVNFPFLSFKYFMMITISWGRPSWAPKTTSSSRTSRIARDRGGYDAIFGGGLHRGSSQYQRRQPQRTSMVPTSTTATPDNLSSILGANYPVEPSSTPTFLSHANPSMICALQYGRQILKLPPKYPLKASGGLEAVCSLPSLEQVCNARHGPPSWDSCTIPSNARPTANGTSYIICQGKSSTFISPSAPMMISPALFRASPNPDRDSAQKLCVPLTEHALQGHALDACWAYFFDDDDPLAARKHGVD